MSNVTVDSFKIPSKWIAPPEDDKGWEDSPFFHLRNQHSVKKGQFFENIVADYLRSKDMKVTPGPKNGEWDIVVDGDKYEIKGAFLRIKADCYWFNQIREEYDYKYLILAGFDPNGTVTLYRFTRDQESSLNIFNLSHGQADKKTGQKSFSGKRRDLQKYVWKCFKHVA